MPSGFSVQKMSKKEQKIYRTLLTLIIVLAALFSLAFLVLISGSVISRFAIAIAVLILSGRMIAVTNGIQDSFGAYLLGGKRGIKFIGMLSRKNPKFWIALADWGLVMGFGVLSFFLFKKYVNKKTIFLSLATMVVIVVIVFPYLPIILSFLNIPQITSKTGVPVIQNVSLYLYEYLQNAPITFYLFLVVGVLGGFGLATIMLLLYSGGSVLYTTSLFLIGFFISKPNYTILTQQIPGVAPLIPGLTLPFFAGLISLFILLVVHEFSHGVLAKIAKVKIKSIGAILFGVIPMGAFVEPNEREVKKLRVSSQDRISIAGVSANMLTSIFFFIIALVLLSIVLPNVSTGGVLVTQVGSNYPANGVIAPNSTITGWNNLTISNDFELANAEAAYVPGNTVLVTTNLGAFPLTPTAGGRLGISVVPAQLTLSYQAANFLYAIAALSFGLNFFVAIFNLLPIPAFDGWRIYQNKIKNKKVLNAISAVLIIAILLNVLPWFWTIG